MGLCSCAGTLEGSYEVQYMRFGKEQVMGSGTYGQVRPCTDLSTAALRAVKTIPKTSLSSRSKILHEIEIMRSISGRHPHIIDYVDHFEEWSVIHLVLEFCPKGNLQDAIASNLLYAREKVLKLGDFGTACVVEEPLRQFEGTPAFAAPEVLRLPRGSGYGCPVDTWAAGIVLFMMVSHGEHPFASSAGNVIKQRIRSGDFETRWGLSWKCQDLLQWLMMPHPDQRIVPGSALEHSWFAAHGIGKGSFDQKKPQRLLLDGHGNWIPANWQH